MYALILAVSFLSPTYDAPASHPSCSAQKEPTTKTVSLFKDQNEPPPAQTSQLKGYYIGGFGGMGRSNGFKVSQNGADFFPLSSGGPLPVVAKGDADADTYGYGGVHVGYDWLRSSECGSYFMRGVEIEGYYASSKKVAILDNPTDRMLEHTFR